jgi:hypothetical protein
LSFAPGKNRGLFYVTGWAYSNKTIGRTSQMEKTSRIPASPRLPQEFQPAKLTPAAQRLKERLSHTPAFERQHRESGDYFWQALANSAAMLD